MVGAPCQGMSVKDYSGIIIETANVMDWGFPLPHLQAIKADVVCAQEHKILDHDVGGPSGPQPWALQLAEFRPVLP